jgi:hypothetical protein
MSVWNYMFGLGVFVTLASHAYTYISEPEHSLVNFVALALILVGSVEGRAAIVHVRNKIVKITNQVT